VWNTGLAPAALLCSGEVMPLPEYRQAFYEALSLLQSTTLNSGAIREMQGTVGVMEKQEGSFLNVAQLLRYSRGVNTEVLYFLELLLLPNPRPKAFGLIDTDMCCSRIRMPLLLAGRHSVPGPFVAEPTWLNTADLRYVKAKGRAGQATHLMLSDVILLAIRMGRAGLMRRWLCTVDAYICDWSNAALTAWGLYILTSGVEDKLMPLFVDCRLTSIPQIKAVKLIKDLHNWVRATHTWPFCNCGWLDAIEATKFHYLSQLFGRLEDYALSAEAEMYMRAAAGPLKTWIGTDGHLLLSDTQRYQQELQLAISQTMEGLLSTHSVYAPSFEEFWASFLTWSSSGSSPGFRTILQGPEGIEKGRVNKRLAIATMDASDILHLIGAPDPILHSRFAIKYENEKNRALWNTSLAFYVLGSYLLASGENKLDGESWCDMNAAAGRRFHDVVRRLQHLENGGDLLAWDYADFNLNHELDVQRKLWLSYARAIQARNTNPKTNALIGRIANWIGTAITHTYLEHTVGGERFILQVSRSLMTGTRGTAFTNTCLNGIYSKLINKCSTELFAQPIFLEPLTGRGDDMISGLTSPLMGAVGAKLINLMGFAGQESKVLMGSVGEFLRQHYIPGHVGGYPARSAAGLTGGEFFNVTVNNPYERYAAILEQLHLARHRGLTVGPLLLEILAARNCKLVGTLHGVKHTIAVDPRVVHARVTNGGMGVHDLNGELNNYEITHNGMPLYAVAGKYLEQLGTKSLQRKAWALHNYGGDNKDCQALLHELISSCIGSDLPSHIVSDGLYHYMLRWLEWKPMLSQAIVERPVIAPVGFVENTEAEIVSCIFHREGVHNNYGILSDFCAHTSLQTLAALKRLAAKPGLSLTKIMKLVIHELPSLVHLRYLEIISIIEHNTLLKKYYLGEVLFNGVPLLIQSNEMRALIRAVVLSQLERYFPLLPCAFLEIPKLVYSVEVQVSNRLLDNSLIGSYLRAVQE
jgi:hypothetical protein